MKKLALLVVGIALVLAITPCYATPVTFANFVNLGGQDVSLLFSNLPNTNTLQITNKPITFYYTNQVIVPAALQGPQSAHLTLTATSHTIASGGTYIDQEGYSGTFTITRDTPYLGQNNLLSGTFNAGELDGKTGGTSAEFGASTPPNSAVVFSSDFVTFLADPIAIQAFSLSMSSVNPSLALNGSSFIRAFAAGESGTFSADMSVPEPLSLLLLGSGLLGLGLLRRRKK